MEKIEFEFDNDYDNSESISGESFLNVVAWATDWTIGSIVNLVQRNKIDLNPRVQRREVWNQDKKSRLIESIMLNIPIPQLILAERSDNKGSYMVIDGKQRLLSIIQFMNSIEQFSIPKYSTLTLDKLNVLKNLNDKTAQDIQKDPILNHYFNVFEGQTLRTIILRNWEDENVLYTVFNRLNTGTVQLSPQELRMTLYPGSFVDFVNENSFFDELSNILNISSPDSRMKDVEFLIRFYSFYYFGEDYDGKLKLFFDKTTKSLNKEWSSKKDKITDDLIILKRILKIGESMFGENVNYSKYDNETKSFSSRINLSIFDMFVLIFKDNTFLDIIEKESENISLLLKCYKELFENKKVKDELSAHTTDLIKVKYRYDMFVEIIEKNFTLNITKVLK